MRKAILALCSSVMLLASGAMAGDLELRIGTEGAYPPWSMANPAGEVTGFDADTGALLCAKLEAKCKFVVQDFAGLIPALQANRVDIIISALSITNDRRKKINFSIPYAELTSYFVAPKDSKLMNVSDLETLRAALVGKRVGVQQGTARGAYVQATMPGVDLKTYESLDQMQIDLEAGRLDAGFSDVSAAKDFLGRPAGENFALVDVKILSSSHPSLGEGVGVGIRHEDAELKAKIDAALCELINDGSLAKASEKWFEASIIAACKQG